MDPVNGRRPPPTDVLNENINFNRIIKKLLKRECQTKFLKTVKKERLVDTKILPSITPQLHFHFKYEDLNNRKDHILLNTKRQLLCLGIEEGDRDVTQLYEEARAKLPQETNIPTQEYITKIKKDHEYITVEYEAKHKKKLEFHRKSKLSNRVIKQKHIKRRTRLTERKERNKIKSRNYRAKKRAERHESINDKVNLIKENNKVINFSSLDIPNTVYLYLAKGLNFVPSYPCDKLDLKYDALEFVRKLSWQHYFKDKEDDNTLVPKEFSILKTQSHKHPTTSHPLIEEIKFKLLSHIESLKTEEPTNNLTPGESRGKSWLSKKLKDKILFVTKADKGGAILIFDYQKVADTIYNELQDSSKYIVKKGDLTKSTSQLLKTLCSKLVKNKYMSPEINTLITGVTEGNVQKGMKQSPDYKAITPYAYPLYKIHSLTTEEFDNRVMPPFRLVYSMKFGPMYRMEKWLSKFLTPLSKEYCGEEYLKDSDHLQGNLNYINSTGGCHNNILLFTMDVKALYPSINPDLAKVALENALANEHKIDMNTKISIWKLVDFSFKNAFIFHHKSSYKPSKGIPTGGSISRQIADIFLKWLLFIKCHENIDWELVRNWWRYIDDIFGIWKGTSQQFELFIQEINTITTPYGITFDKFQVGRTVTFLDMEIYLSNNENDFTKIYTRLYRKPTDSMRFLHRHSFHAPHTFTSVPFSQLIRVDKRNSNKEDKDEDTEELLQGFIDAGYGEEELMSISNKFVHYSEANLDNHNIDPIQKTLIFSFRYFKEYKETKLFLKSLQPDIQDLIGAHRLIIACKRGQNIGDFVLRNRKLCFLDPQMNSQKCGQPNCKICPSMLDSDKLVINEKEFKLPHGVNCNTENVIYYAECTQCNSNNGYIGRTLQRFNNRGSGHRSCFNNSDFEKSALSMHAMMDHQMNCSMENYRFAILKKTHPLNLHRDEYIHIEKGRTLTKGLNRMQVRH